MSKEIILYDLPSRGSKPTCWSLNPWKARLVMNYKSIPYKTQWIEYPDIAPTFKSLGIPPNDPAVNPNAAYSCPAITLPDGRHIMDSLAIAHELEKLYPEPRMSFDNAEKVQESVLKVNKALATIVLPRIPELVLTDSSRPYFLETRETRFGKPLSEVKSDVHDGECWENARVGLDEIKEFLGGEGPFVNGKSGPGFADFILAGFWRFMERASVEEKELVERLMAVDESFVRHREAVGKWLERDD